MSLSSHALEHGGIIAAVREHTAGEEGGGTEVNIGTIARFDVNLSMPALQSLHYLYSY